MAKQKDESLAEQPEVVIDDRPKFSGKIRLPGGLRVRIRRMQPEQIFVQLAKFKAAGIDPACIYVAGRKRTELQQMIQRCLVDERNRLVFPGVNGLQQIVTFTDSQLADIAKQVIEFQEY
jgi:hypothetical protein